MEKLESPPLIPISQSLMSNLSASAAHFFSQLNPQSGHVLGPWGPDQGSRSPTVALLLSLLPLTTHLHLAAKETFDECKSDPIPPWLRSSEDFLLHSNKELTLVMIEGSSVISLVIQDPNLLATWGKFPDF